MINSLESKHTQNKYLIVQKVDTNQFVFSQHCSTIQEGSKYNQDCLVRQHIHKLELQLQQVTDKNKVLQKQKQLLNKRNAKYLQQNQELTIRITLLKQQYSKMYGNQTSRSTLLGQINILKMENQFTREQIKANKQNAINFKQKYTKLQKQNELLQKKYADTISQINLLFQQRYQLQQKQIQFNNSLQQKNRQILTLKQTMGIDRKQLKRVQGIMEIQLKSMQSYQQKLRIANEDEKKTRDTKSNYLINLQSKCKEMVQQNQRVIRQYQLLKGQYELLKDQQQLLKGEHQLLKEEVDKNKYKHSAQITQLRVVENKNKQYTENMKKDYQKIIQAMMQKNQQLKLNKQSTSLALKTIQNSLQSKKNEFDYEKQRYADQITKLKAQIQQLEKQNERFKQIQKELHSMQAKLQQLQNSIKFLNYKQTSKTSQLEQQIKYLRKTLNQNQKRYLFQIESLQAQLATSKTQFLNLQSALPAFKQQLQNRKKDYLILHTHFQYEQTNNQKLKQINLQLNQKSSQLTNYNMKLKEELIKSETDRYQLKQQIEQLSKKHNKNLQIKIQDYRNQLQIARQQKQQLEADMKSQLDNRKKMIETLIKEKKMLYVCMD